jgi:hypothetical protein
MAWMMAGLGNNACFSTSVILKYKFSGEKLKPTHWFLFASYSLYLPSHAATVDFSTSSSVSAWSATINTVSDDIARFLLLIGNNTKKKCQK